MGTRIEDLTEIAQPAAVRLQNTTAHSLKKILSAGVIVLSKMPPEKVQRAIAEASGLEVIDADLYAPGETYLAPGKLEFRKAVLEILRESGLISKTTKRQKPPSSSKSA